MDTMTVQERARLNRQRELDADLATAAELMGGSSLEACKSTLYLLNTLNAEHGCPELTTIQHQQII